MSKIDDGAMVWMGSGGFDCCDPSISQIGTADESVLFASKDLASSTSGSQKSWVYMEEGFFYPLRIVYINVLTDAALQFSIKNPDGTLATDSVYQLSGDLTGHCTTKTFTTSMRFYTFYTDAIQPGVTIKSPYTTTIDGVEVLVVLETIGVDSFVSGTITLESTWDETYTSTITTVTTYVSNGDTYAEEAVIIEEPALPTHTTYWDNN